MDSPDASDSEVASQWYIFAWIIVCRALFLVDEEIALIQITVFVWQVFYDFIILSYI